MTPLVIKSSAKAIIGWLILSTVVLLAIVAFLYNQKFEPPSLWALLAIPLAIDLWAIVQMVKLNSRRLILTTDMLRLEEGMMSKVQRSMMLSKIQDVRVDQTAGQRMWGVGDLVLQAAGETLPLTMSSIDRPRVVADRILEAARESRKG